MLNISLTYFKKFRYLCNLSASAIIIIITLLVYHGKIGKIGIFTSGRGLLLFSSIHSNRSHQQGNTAKRYKIDNGLLSLFPRPRYLTCKTEVVFVSTKLYVFTLLIILLLLLSSLPVSTDFPFFPISINCTPPPPPPLVSLILHMVDPSSEMGLGCMLLRP